MHRLFNPSKRLWDTKTDPISQEGKETAMYATVARVQLQPGRVDEGNALWQQSILPVLKQQPGFRGLIILGDAQSNKGMAVLVWDSSTDAEAGLNAPQVQQAFEPGMAMLAGQPDVEGYNVGLLELS